MLIEHQLFGLVNNPATAIERLKTFEAQALAKHPDGYYVAFSGGKDSIVLLDLVRRAGVKHTAHFHLTTVDPPELIRYVRKHYPDVILEHAPMSMWQLIKKKMVPPTRIVRYCCEHLKERGGTGRIVVTGVRWAESVKRSNRAMVEACSRNASKSFLHPIIDWTDADVWQYIRENKMPYCCLYDEGFKRIGCIGCPMAEKLRYKEFARWPQYERLYRKAFSEAVALAKASGVYAERQKKHGANHLRWSTGDAMFRWWMQENKKTDSDQCVLFE